MEKDKLFHQPVQPFVLNQRFGENNACVDLATNSKVITCDGFNPPAGYKSLYGTKGHLGIDLQIFHGQPVFNAQNGVVVSIDTNPKSGLDVRIKSVLNCKTYLHIYEHLLGYQVKIGDNVLTGQLIGWADNTGYSSGDHLHFQLEELVDADGHWLPIDPMPIMSEMFALDVLSINNKLKYIQEQLAGLLDKMTDWLRK